MAARARISLEHVEDVAAGTVMCIVRCLEGAVSPGDVFDIATSVSGVSTTVSLRVVHIWRYGKTTDLLDPPHASEVELAGPDVALLPTFASLAISHTE